MRINETTVNKVARLARLAITPTETLWFQRQLGTLLDYVDLLKEVPESMDLADKQNDIETVLRNDIEVSSIDRDKTLKQSSKYENGYFKVSRVMDKS